MNSRKTFTELLDDYLDAKRDFDEAKPSIGESWHRFEDSYTYKRFDATRDALNALFTGRADQ